MKATVENGGHMVLPAKARKEAQIEQGDVLEVMPDGIGRITLVRLERPGESRPLSMKVIHRKGRYDVASTDRAVTPEMVKAGLEEFP